MGLNRRLTLREQEALLVAARDVVADTVGVTLAAGEDAYAIHGGPIDALREAVLMTHDAACEEHAAVASRGDREAMAEVHGLLTGKVWSADTLDDIADVVRSTGRTIEEPEEDIDDAEDTSPERYPSPQPGARDITITLTPSQAKALLACAEVGHEGADDAGVERELTDAAWEAMCRLRTAVDPTWTGGRVVEAEAEAEARDKKKRPFIHNYVVSFEVDSDYEDGDAVPFEELVAGMAVAVEDIRKTGERSIFECNDDEGGEDNAVPSGPRAE